MTNEQILAVYNLGKDKRAEHTSIVSYSGTTPSISFSFAKGTSLEEATEIVKSIFPDKEFSPTHNLGQYQSGYDIFFHVNELGGGQAD